MEAFSLLHVPLERLRPSKPFSGVSSGSSNPLWQIHLPVTFGTCDNYRTELIDFDISRIDLPYNAIVGYPALARFMAATHRAYNLMKMPGSKGILTMAGDTKEAMAALKLAFKVAGPACPAGKTEPRVKGAAPTKKKQLFTQGQAKTKQIPVDEDGASGATFTISADLDPDPERALVDLLRENKEVFARQPQQLVGVPRGVIEHHRKVCPNVRPVKQKTRRQSADKQSFIVQETRKLEAAGIIREVRYPEWLENPVVVPKKGVLGNIVI
ncbi:uncharacterized protein [Aegilops tauschii subsp. strangulata]|uniref:uncharacterized protein n=1 Tax=Aegilops tauschii subsp. strangulata TaxID=200361 RepID=UPI003CC8811A